MIKTISFSAVPEQLHKYLQRLEGERRRDVTELEEDATRAEADEKLYVLGIAASPVDPSGAAAPYRARTR